MKPEWPPEMQRRLDELRGREEAGSLTQAEQQELDEVITTLDELESQQLQQAAERMKREQKAALQVITRLENTRDDLMDLAARQRQLIVRARTQLKDLLAEHRVLLADYRRLNIEPSSS